MIYDPFQQIAIDYINQGSSVIVSAPTGAGKTVIAEHVITECLAKGEKVIYTAPIKALSNQKFRDFQKSSPDQVGLLTGDVSLNPQAAILIMTTEIFRNKILEEKNSLKDYTWTIFDEIHYLDDEERGSVWEESLIFFPEHMRLLGLSATIPNIDELAQWITSIHPQPIQVVKEFKRPVPLHFAYQCQGDIYDDFEQLTKKGFRSPEFPHYRVGKLPRFARVRPNKVIPLVQHLNNKDLLPCIYFVFSRRRTEYLAQEIQAFNFLSSSEQEKIRTMFDQLCERFELTGEASVDRIRPFIEHGIAYHHAGMLPTLKEVVEQLFTSRLIKVIFTTETFALGINMPARSVIFDELTKFYGRGYGPLRTRDFYQMAGRAGRRSIDAEGYVFCRVNPHDISPQELHRIIHSQPEKVRSQFNASYATLLNLYQTYGEKLYDVYPHSFHHYQVRKFLQKKAVDLLRAKVGLLKELGHIQDQKLTEKGLFAAKIYGYELILSHLHERGFLEALSLEALCILSLAVVYEPRRGMRKPTLDRRAAKLEEEVTVVMNEIHRKERHFGISPVSKRCMFHLTKAMEAWMSGADFAEILKHTEADEGEVVRFFRMSIQVLREIREAPISFQMQERIQKIIGLINRDVIDSEKQLRS